MPLGPFLIVPPLLPEERDPARELEIEARLIREKRRAARIRFRNNLRIWWCKHWTGHWWLYAGDERSCFHCPAREQRLTDITRKLFIWQ